MYIILCNVLFVLCCVHCPEGTVLQVLHKMYCSVVNYTVENALSGMFSTVCIASTVLCVFEFLNFMYKYVDICIQYNWLMGCHVLSPGS